MNSTQHVQILPVLKVIQWQYINGFPKLQQFWKAAR